MEEPKLPTLPHGMTGMEITIKPKDLPETWPDFVTNLGTYILQMYGVNDDDFNKMVDGLLTYLKGMDEAITLYDEDAWDDKDTVPEWYKNLDGWKKEDETDHWIEEALEVMLNMTIHKWTSLKVNLLLNLFQLPWPDFIGACIEDIERYKAYN